MTRPALSDDAENKKCSCYAIIKVCGFRVTATLLNKIGGKFSRKGILYLYIAEAHDIVPHPTR